MQPLSAPYAQLALIVGALWCFVGTFAAVCVIAEWVGTRIARRAGRQCPHCDYRGLPVEIASHQALEHDGRASRYDWPTL